MLTRSLPFLPIISPRLIYFDRLLFTLPRTSLRKRWWSRSIFWPTAASPQGGVDGKKPRAAARGKSLPRAAARGLGDSFFPREHHPSYFFACPRAKMLATKLSTSVAQM